VPGCEHCDAPRAGAADSRFRRILWFALAVNALMFVVEIAASWLSGSMALQADALDFLGDSFNYAISLVVLGMALRTRAQAALVKGATMAAFGLWVLGSTAHRVWVGTPPDAGVMGTVGLLALSANVAVAVALFRYRGGDSNMRSIWLCSRNDALGNIAVIGAAAGVFATGAHWPDLLVAGIVASLNLSAAAQVARHAMGELASLPRGDSVAPSAGDETIDARAPAPTTVRQERGGQPDPVRAR
jgi:Co/Zn/Cd efflux system component